MVMIVNFRPNILEVDRQVTSLWHGIPRIEAKVQNHLHQMRMVGVHSRRGREQSFDFRAETRKRCASYSRAAEQLLIRKWSMLSQPVIRKLRQVQSRCAKEKAAGIGGLKFSEKRIRWNYFSLLKVCCKICQSFKPFTFSCIFAFKSASSLFLVGLLIL